MQTHTFKGNNRAMFTDNAGKHFIYHSTCIVKVTPDNKIILNADGWIYAPSTRNAMNQVSNEHGLRFRVFQKDKVPYIEHKGEAFKYFDNITLEH